LYYEVLMLDTTYVQDLLPGLRSGLYGSSVRFRTLAEDLNRHPARSSYNPDGIPERTIREARLFEFSVATFPAYAGATAGVRGFAPRWTLSHRLVAGLETYLPVVVATARGRPGPWDPRRGASRADGSAGASLAASLSVGARRIEGSYS